jgi:hypothetical protein
MPGLRVDGVPGPTFTQTILFQDAMPDQRILEESSYKFFK